MKNKGTLALGNAMLFSEEKSTKSEPFGFGFWLFGGGGGSRTPVRKHFHGNFSGRRQSFVFPHLSVG